MQLRHLLESVDIVNGPQDTDAEASEVSYVAGKCKANSLFVAIKGLQHDGHDYIPDAAARGARFIVHDREVNIPAGITSIRVNDSRKALGVLARNYFKHPSGSMVLVAVTGTSGKTTIAYLLEAILKTAKLNCGVLGTVNYRYADKIFSAPNTTPESFEMQKILREMADEGITHVIAEVSSHALALKRVDACDFDLAIFANLSPEHLDYHRNMEEYFQAKKRLFGEILPLSKKKNKYKMVINGDDEWGKRILREIELPSLSFGMGADNAVRGFINASSLSGIKAELVLDDERMFVESELIGNFNAYNIMAAATAAKALGVTSPAIKTGIANLNYVPGRLEKVDTPLGFNVFVDYAHKADALRQVLQALTDLKKNRVITVFGCGGNRDRAKRPLMGKEATDYSDLTIVTSDNPRLEDPLAIIAEIEAGIDQKKIRKMSRHESLNGNASHAYMIVPQRKKAIEIAINMAQKDDIVLIAGKGHEDYQIMGTEKTPFDDRVVAAEALKKRE
ncbi:MAG TPA: UDP-N-acetylmuramoyl-L-alanyl-D-glutamate--2,6-diaminopimelate ligase [Deltaproteobacteria bacterium]|nr:UDP-N-acetylmuramoyl-L-alanyl-D-glutamate--2,6-diaminopimelate ligase [Deltaproteobacteria bacterium]